MNKEFIPYTLALALKELGFDEECFAYYNLKEEIIFKSCHNRVPIIMSGKKCGIPLYQQAFRWFSDSLNLYAEIYTTTIGGQVDFTFQIRDLYTEEYIYDNFSANVGGYSGTSTTERETEINAINKLIEIAKEKNQK